MDAGDHSADGAALATPGSVPSYLITAMTHYPDYLHRLGMHRAHEILINEAEEEMDRDLCEKQPLVMVADRIAC